MLTSTLLQEVGYHRHCRHGRNRCCHSILAVHVAVGLNLYGIWLPRRIHVCLVQNKKYLYIMNSSCTHACILVRPSLHIQGRHITVLLVNAFADVAHIRAYSRVLCLHAPSPARRMGTNTLQRHRLEEQSLLPSRHLGCG